MKKPARRLFVILPVSSVTALSLLLLSVGPLLAGDKKTDDGLLTLERIFASKDFNGDSLGTIRWLKKNSGYTTTEASKEVKGSRDIVRYEPKSGKREVLVSASHLIPPGREKPLSISSFYWSPDESMVLIFTNTKRVWRYNTRGDYWVFDITTRKLHKLGGDAKPSTLMFAKFSPDSKKVAYVRDKKVFVENLITKKIVQLTQRESPTIINGTFDWVYEEELSLRDGIRWSPDSTMIAYWQLDTSGVRDYHLINNTAQLYPKIKTFKYPKAGNVNSAGKVGVVSINGERTTVWIDVPGDPRNHYIARMDWAPRTNKDSVPTVILQQLNRLQNTNKIMLAPVPAHGILSKLIPNVILTEKDKAWIDVHDELHWFDHGRRFLWLSERDGWQHAYAVSRGGEEVKLITTGDFDVMDIVSIDKDGGWLYFYASPDNPTQQYLFAARLDGSKVQKITPNKMRGTNTYNISPDGKWAIHTHSTFDSPNVSKLVTLPDHKEVRVLVDNKKLRENVNKLKRRRTEFFRVDIGVDVELDGWCMKPYNFDPNLKYPVLFYVYGEPAGQTVLDRWSKDRYLWHLMLTHQGYVVMSVDNRGTPAPRGRDFRKIVYRKVGILAPKDQALAVKAIQKKWEWVDAQRIGVWGWSGGGTMSLHAIFRYPDLYHMAMSIAPVTNERFYDTIYQERYMGLPSDNVKGYRDGSPIKYAHQLKGKLLLVHGTADDNVHYANTEALVNELIRNNKQFSMMAYPNRSHSIREGKNTRRHLFTLLTNYLHQNLPAGPINSAVLSKGKVD